MGQSVLTPEEDLLGKVGELLFGTCDLAEELLTRHWGKGNSDQDSETGLWGMLGLFGSTRGCKAADDGRSPG